MSGLLEGRAILVTGAAGGLGGAVCTAALDEDARAVVAADLKPDDVDRSHALADRISPLELDVTSPASWAAAIAFVQESCGGLDALVNNAGITDRAGLVDLEVESWNRVLAVNQTGVFLGMKAATPLLAGSRAAAIVNIASFAAHTGYKAIAYTASKWAVRAMTQVAATELGPLGIRVNSVSPGFVETPLTRNAMRIVEAFARSTPVGRPCRPAEIADAVVYLASERSSFVTGTDLLVDGGYLASTTRFVTS
ncbi:MAG: SDR family NAD(P)-dependent oxidoreductase [Pseudonocardia sp.]